MNPPKSTNNDFINFLIATYQNCTWTEASRCLPSETEPIAYDSVKRLLEASNSSVKDKIHIFRINLVADLLFDIVADLGMEETMYGEVYQSLVHAIEDGMNYKLSKKNQKVVFKEEREPLGSIPHRSYIIGEEYYPKDVEYEKVREEYPPMEIIKGKMTKRRQQKRKSNS